SHLSGRPVRLPVLVTRNSSRTLFSLPLTGPSTTTSALKALPRLAASSIAIATAVRARMATTITIRPVGPRSSRLRRPGAGGGAVAEGLDTALRLAGRPGQGSGVVGGVGEGLDTALRLAGRPGQGSVVVGVVGGRQTGVRGGCGGRSPPALVP